MSLRATASPALVLAFLAGLGACEGSTPSGGAPAGTLVGQVTAGPFCPVETQGQECPPPRGTYESIRVLVFARLASEDRLVAETRPDANGRFELRLSSGAYRVTLEHWIGIPGAPPAIREALVEADAITMIAFDLDTGIR